MCGNVYSSAVGTLNHIRNAHGYDIPARRVEGKSRPLENDYDEEHYACLACWFHCSMDELPVLHYHTIMQHSPRPIITERERNNYMYTRTNSRRSGPSIF